MPLILSLSNSVSQVFCLYFPISKVAHENLGGANITIQIQAEGHKSPNPPNSDLSFLEGEGKILPPKKEVSDHPFYQPITACSNYFILNSLALFIIFRKLLPLPRRFNFCDTAQKYSQHRKIHRKHIAQKFFSSRPQARRKFFFLKFSSFI